MENISYQKTPRERQRVPGVESDATMPIGRSEETYTGVPLTVKSARKNMSGISSLKI
jgi:hypothetical protein